MTDLQRYLPARLPTLDRMVAIVVLISNRLSSFAYRSLFKRNAVYLTAIFASAFAFELCVTSPEPPCYTEMLTKAFTKQLLRHCLQQDLGLLERRRMWTLRLPRILTTETRDVLLTLLSAHIAPMEGHQAPLPRQG